MSEPNSGTRIRESFPGRSAFILAAIGSAVGLGNIWRFPYIAYENGGGAFLVPYLVALLSAGLPLLFFDYAIGHKFKGSPPMAFRRMSRWSEGLGWWQVLICVVISVYYAAVIAWAGYYTVLSFNLGWGDDPGTFLMEDFLRVSGDSAIKFEFVGAVFWPLLIVWIVCLGAIALGVQKGIAAASKIFMPLLFVMFLVLVGYALTLPGATTGLNELFTPQWSKLSDPAIWVAAYGQIFFSLSVAFGIMITYASYLKPKTDLTGSALVVGFANSAFENLAAIGVFAVLGFMAVASNQPVSEVAGAGIGLAFVAFPAILNEAPAGQLLGVLFFGSLVFAGLTSQISILEVVIAALKDKMGWTRKQTVLVVGGGMGVISILLYPTTTGLTLLDVTDHFVNNIGIVGVALAATVSVTYIFRKLPVLAAHLNRVSSIKIGKWWFALVGGIVPLVLVWIWGGVIIQLIKEPYGGYDRGYVNVVGWGMSIMLVVFAIILSFLPWPKKSALFKEELDKEEAS